MSSILLGLMVSAAPALGQASPVADTTTATPSDAVPLPSPKPPAPPPTGRPTYQVMSQETPITRLKLDNGFARWVNRREAPNTFYSVRAPMTVDIYVDWVMIRTEGGAVHVVPREFLIYVGSQSLDEF